MKIAVLVLALVITLGVVGFNYAYGENCGAYKQSCCLSLNPCYLGLVCSRTSETCVYSNCGGPTQICCTAPGADPCNGGYVCDADTCVPSSSSSTCSSTNCAVCSQTQCTNTQGC